MRPEDLPLADALVALGFVSRDVIDALDDRPLDEFLMSTSTVTPAQLRQARERIAPAEATLKREPGSSRPTEPAVPEEVRSATGSPRQDIGKFVLVKLLGRGGMGEVWKAWAKDLRRYVAVKFFLGATDDDRTRLVREAQVAARLEHPGIVPVYEVGESPRGPFIAMKFVEGETLDRATLTLEQRLQAVRDAAQAIDYAHAQGVIHRDIKPQNILVEAAPVGTPTPGKAPQRPKGEKPRVYVMDFGLAKQTSVETSISISGVVVGTPEYMSPEQARGQSKDVDPRSDVYSLAAALYRVVAGVAPFRGDSALAVLEKVVKDDPPPPSRFYAGLSRDVQTIIQKGMEKEKDRRYATARDLAEDLRRYLEGEPIDARPASLVYRVRKFAVRRKAFVAILVLAALLVGAGLFLLLWPARVVVSSKPEGAAIFLDGRDTGKVTPARVTLWPPGKRMITLRKAGFDEAPLEVNAGAAQTVDASANLVKNAGTLTVTSVPPGATVELHADERIIVLGPTPVEDAEVPRGIYTLHFHLARYEEVSERVEIRADAVAKVEKILPPETGRLQVDGNVAGIVMTAESLDRGHLEPRLFSVTGGEEVMPTGRHRLKFSAVNYFPRSAEVRVDKDRTRRARATLNPMRRWSVALGNSVSGAAAVADLDGDGVLDVIVGCNDDRVYALSGADGSKLWEYRTGDTVQTTPAVADLNGDGVFDVVAGSDDGKVHAISGKDGSRLWEVTTHNWVRSSPALGDLNADGVPDVVIGCKDDRVYALSGRGGARLWVFDAGSDVNSSPALGDLNGDGTPDAVVGSDDGHLYALSGRDGSELWKFKTEDDVVSSPALADLDGDGTLDAVVGSVDGRLYAVSGKTGAKLWAFETSGSVTSSPALGDLDGDGTADAVVGSRSGSVTAVSGKSGRRIWEFGTGGPVLSSPALADLDGDGAADCVVGSNDSNVHVISGRGGELLWRFKTMAFIESSPTLADLDGDGDLECVVGSGDYSVYVLHTRDLAKQWEFRAGQPVVSSPAAADLDGDGAEDFVAGSDEGKLYALSGVDGAKLWEFSTRTGRTIRSSPAKSDLNGDGVADFVFGSDDRSAYAVSGRDGSPLWEFKTGGRVRSSPALADLDADGVPDAVFGSSDLRVYAVSGRTGLKIWDFKTGGFVEASPLAADVNADGVADFIIGSDDAKVYALSGKDGAKLWEFATGGPVRSTPAAGSDFLVGSDDGKVYAFSARGAKLWEFAAGGRVRTEPALADLNGDGKPDVVVVTVEGRVVAVSGAERVVLWVFEGASGEYSPVPADVDGDGVPDAIVTDTDGALVALSGRDGGRLLHVAAESDSERIHVSSGLAVFGTRDRHVRAVLLESRAPLPAVAGFAARGPRIGVARTAMELRGAVWRHPDGATLPRVCADLLKGEKDGASRRLLLIRRADALLREGKTGEAREALEELRGSGASYAVHAYSFLCRPTLEDLTQALEADPERACALLRERWPSGREVDRALEGALETLVGFPRIAALTLNADWDLAMQQLHASEAAGEEEARVARLRGFLPRGAKPILDRARELAAKPERVVALALLALARAGRGEHAPAAEMAADACLELKEVSRAIEILDAVLRRDDLTGEERSRLEELRRKAKAP